MIEKEFNEEEMYQWARTGMPVLLSEEERQYVLNDDHNDDFLRSLGIELVDGKIPLTIDREKSGDLTVCNVK